ncbi:MAG: hypothetical protein AAF892_18800 [Cyanobacteria bacterium P01_D01_bin.71]
MAKCRLFLREKNTLEWKEGLGVHSFGRVPVVGEYISLSSQGSVYRVTHVHHTGFNRNHIAELYVVGADDIQIVGGDPVPMP